jgi:hypothetical protein
MSNETLEVNHLFVPLLILPQLAVGKLATDCYFGVFLSSFLLPVLQFGWTSVDSVPSTVGSC